MICFFSRNSIPEGGVYAGCTNFSKTLSDILDICLALSSRKSLIFVTHVFLPAIVTPINMELEYLFFPTTKPSSLLQSSP